MAESQSRIDRVPGNGAMASDTGMQFCLNVPKTLFPLGILVPNLVE